MRSSERSRAPGPDGSLSLILPRTDGGALIDRAVENYRQVLEDRAGFESIEVIVVVGVADGPADASLTERRAAGDGRVGLRRIQVEGEDWSTLARAGLEASTGDHLIVLDVDRHYSPGAILEVLDPVSTGRCDLAVAVPAPDRAGRLDWSRPRVGLGRMSRMFLGSSDVFSGLFVLRRSVWELDGRPLVASRPSLVLELLLRRPARCLDVPVAVDPQFRPQRMGLRDLRPLKHVLDGRFGNLSRLIQFCVVGASGMVVDLSLYALFQWILSYTWLVDQTSRLLGFSWHLAIAGSLSIALALLWNFSWNRRLTFNDARSRGWLRQFMTYALSNALAIALNLSLRLYLPTRVGFFARHRLAAAVVGIVAATGISFSMSRWIVFSRRSDRTRPPHLPPRPRVGRPSALV